MLDKRTARILSVITKFCSDGSYKIIEIADLIKEMPPRSRVGAEDLGAIMRFLADGEMINIKYSDDKVYCVAVLPRGRVVDEESRIKRNTDKGISRLTISFLLGGSFIMALVGAFLGAFLAGFL